MPMARQFERNVPCRTFGLAVAIVGSSALVAVMGPPGPAKAEPIKWGGIAYSKSTGAFGFSFGSRTQEETKQRALRQCRVRSAANDCLFVRGFAGSCGGLAVIETEGKSPTGLPQVDRIYAVATGKTRSAAEAAAVAKCKHDNGKLDLPDNACRLITSICSNGR